MVRAAAAVTFGGMARMSFSNSLAARSLEAYLRILRPSTRSCATHLPSARWYTLPGSFGLAMM